MKNIPYEKIDVEIVQLIKVLNEICKIPTKRCCSGHGKSSFYIQFDESVYDEQIYELCSILFDNIENKNNNYLMFSVEKWGRKLNGKFQYNWALRSQIGCSVNEVFNLINKITEVLIDKYQDKKPFEEIINWLESHSGEIISDDEYIFENCMFPYEVDVILRSIQDIKIINECYQKNVKLIQFEYKYTNFLLCIDLNTGRASIS